MKQNKLWYKLINKHAYILKYFSPFLSIINKGVKVKQNVLPLFVRNKNQQRVKSNQNIMIPIEKNIYQFSAKVYIETSWYQMMIPIENKLNIFKIPKKKFDTKLKDVNI